MCVIVGVSFKYLAVEQTVAEILLRLVVGDGSFLFRFAIGRRFILALRHDEIRQHVSMSQ